MKRELGNCFVDKVLKKVLNNSLHLIMVKYLFFLIFPFTILAQNAEEVTQLLTASTWNIAYQIDAEGNRTEEEDEDVIRQNWVNFFEDGTYEMPAGITGKVKGKWTYNPANQLLSFQEGRTAYRAKIEEISEINLLLHYINDGGFKIGLIHHVHIPKEKSSEESFDILTSGKWIVSLKRYDGGVVDKTPTAHQNDTWFIFSPDGTYQKSEILGEETVTSEGVWFIDSNLNLNLDSSENSIYTIVGDNSKLILTATSGGYNTIEMRKSND